MKKITTTIDKEYDYFGHIFTKEQVEECFVILAKEGYIHKVEGSDEYELDDEKFNKLIEEL